MKTFPCIMHGQPRTISANAARAAMLRKIVGSHNALNSVTNVYLERLPPRKVCLIPHIQWVNYTVSRYKQAGNARVESPKSHDPGMCWEKIEVLKPVWSIEPILLHSLSYLLKEQNQKRRLITGKIVHLIIISVSN